MSQEVVIEGKRVPVGKRIGRGGEGDVYLLADTPDRLVKIYHAGLADTLREQKVAAMVAAGLARRTELVAYPLQIARALSGRFAGFVMRFVRDHQELHQLFGVKTRKTNFPKADYRFIARTASNVARAVASVHESGCVIGDVNQKGILISSRAVAALIDADSFQFSAGGARFPCLVGMPEYTPPELQGRSLKGVERTANHDAFGLATAIFQLLFMGRHPFSGVGRGDMPLEQGIAQYRFAYSRTRQTGVTPPPGICTLNDFPAPVADAFERAFAPGGAARPTARDWVTLLGDFEKALVPCRANPLHHYPSAAKDCPWCRMERAMGVVLFIPPLIEFTPGQVADPGAAGFDLDAVWRAIEAVAIPSAESLTPVLPAAATGPSPEARKAQAGGWGRRLGGVGALAGAALLLSVLPWIWPAYLGLGFYGLYLIFQKEDLSTNWSGRYRAAEEKWRDALEAWRGRSGAAKLLELKAELAAARQEYVALAHRKAERVRAYNDARHAKQLEAFLDRFLIARTKIRYIGPTRLATLASFGIETAADINQQKVGALAGFGPAITAELVAWRRGVEKRFIYNPNRDQADQQALRTIDMELAAEASKLRRRLSPGPSGLRRLADAIQLRARTPDPEVSRAHAVRAQAEADLAFLGIPKPVIAPRAPKRVTPSAPARRPPAPPRGQPGRASAHPNCPRCGATMVQRTARRGGRAGRAFWGCSRYPGCRGTRTI